MRWLLVSIVCVIVAGCLGSKCENTVLQDVMSPDGKRMATLFERNCGATAPFVQVVILRNSGSDFIGDNTVDYIFTMKGQQKIKIEWLNANSLMISRPPHSTDIFRELKLWNGVEITYRNI